MVWEWALPRVVQVKATRSGPESTARAVVELEMAVRAIRRKREVWLVVREDEPTHGEWFLRERDASLKATWLRQSWKAKVSLVKTSITDTDTDSAADAADED